MLHRRPHPLLPTQGKRFINSPPSSASSVLYSLRNPINIQTCFPYISKKQNKTKNTPTPSWSHLSCWLLYHFLTPINSQACCLQLPSPHSLTAALLRLRPTTMPDLFSVKFTDDSRWVHSYCQYSSYWPISSNSELIFLSSMTDFLLSAFRIPYNSFFTLYKNLFRALSWFLLFSLHSHYCSRCSILSALLFPYTLSW